jgi:GH24 family phage-related lysozyme (muramidase)
MKRVLFVLSLLTAFIYQTKAQDTNPYKDFGYVAKNEYVRTKKPVGIEVNNTDSASATQSIIISPQFSKVFVYDRRGNLQVKDVAINDKLRFLSVDPLTGKYPELTPYQFASNSPISGIDLDGLERVIYLVNMSQDKITWTTLTVTKSLPDGRNVPVNGPLGGGVAVQLTRNNSVHTFYGNDATSERQFTEFYEGTGIPGHPFERYNDSKGLATIGYGHLMTDADKKLYPLTASNKPFAIGSKITPQAADELFINNYNDHKNTAIKSLNNSVSSDAAISSFADFSFNIRKASQRIKDYLPTQGGNFFLGYMPISEGAGNERRRLAEAIGVNQGILANLEYLRGQPDLILNTEIKTLTAPPVPSKPPVKQ